MKVVAWDDYIIHGQVDAIDTVRDLLKVPDVHTVGYCVAGTTLAATLALLAARGEADKVRSATFFTAPVDFSRSEEHTSELQSLMRISYAVFCLKKNNSV